MSDVRLNRTNIDSHWTIKRSENKQRKTVTYKSDGLLFKEDREAVVINKVKRVDAHAHDDYIQGHKDVSDTYSVIPPWYDSFADLTDELTMSYTINFNKDGTAEAILNTKYVEREWETVKKHDPVSLKKEAK